MDHCWCLTPWASYQIPEIGDCACAGNAGNVFPATDFKWNRFLAIAACITARAVIHVGIANQRWRGKHFPAFPAHGQPAILRIWQEVHTWLIMMAADARDPCSWLAAAPHRPSRGHVWKSLLSHNVNISICICTNKNTNQKTNILYIGWEISHPLLSFLLACLRSWR